MLEPEESIMGSNAENVAENPHLNAGATAWVCNSAKGYDVNTLTDRGEITKLYRVINGGDNGLQERIAMYHNAEKVFGVN